MDAGPEACAWRERHHGYGAEEHANSGCFAIDVSASWNRGHGCVTWEGYERGNDAANVDADEVKSLDVIADVVALLLENTRLLERDRERIHELSLLNSISNQMNCAMYERERLTEHHHPAYKRDLAGGSLYVD